METAYVQTPIGTAELKGDTLGLSSVTVLEDNKPNGTIPDVLKDAAKQFEEYFNGDRTVFNLKLNPSGTDFQKKVWDALLKIPFGKTISYLELSKQLGDVKAIRAVASANGKNPLWIVVPCHRVIGTNGDLTGYAGGLHRKKWLLEHESPAKQTTLF
ncbi:methylated-DNA--[protein]-cysteine S-methyltransferase [Muricauda oceani]|uniref:Methylated-DNA--protein-cysteine methyltransferase n=1 Tax=Flagellimonas oceani TaxID=2698672 RepID=A0A6G7J7U1_9FLAO|nr:methylated-DNA--[protein]-cysteine S-methyltransferase [Allomuricauda oceani]MBW8243152.1 methylated-DNA--[protein]-cysteine S-methyltransferase [Allomuricauda oceani]QII46502.1 methylated-DNA--[protein]-cysteine S-methyltransferase [Allomuricauda oceani]